MPENSHDQPEAVDLNTRFALTVPEAARALGRPEAAAEMAELAINLMKPPIRELSS